MTAGRPSRSHETTACHLGLSTYDFFAQAPPFSLVHPFLRLSSVTLGAQLLHFAGSLCQVIFQLGIFIVQLLRFEEIALLKAATPEVRQAIILAIDTGLRREELFSLRWNQIDLSHGVITTTTNTKSGRARTVPLPTRSREILPERSGIEYVLINPETRKRYVQMNKGLEGAVRRAGLAHVQWHDLRRTAGCRWLQTGRRSIEEVSLMLGHSSVQVTEKCYAFLDSAKVAASISFAS